MSNQTTAVEIIKAKDAAEETLGRVETASMKRITIEDLKRRRQEALDLAKNLEGIIAGLERSDW